MSLFGRSYHNTYFYAPKDRPVPYRRRKLFCYDGPLGKNPHEINLVISENDFQRYNAVKAETDRMVAWNEIGSFIEVTDVTTGEKWMIASAPCGAQCHCACVAVRPI